MDAQPAPGLRGVGYVGAAGAVAGVSLVLASIYYLVDQSFGALIMLIVVLLVALRWGVGPANFAAVLSAATLNYYWNPPPLTFTTPTGYELTSLGVFLFTGVTVGTLSARAQRRRQEAETARQEVQKLYDELRAAMERAAELEVVKRSEKLKSALLDTVTHDLRTPLTAIKAAGTTLLKGSRLDDETRHELLEVVVQECDRLNHFIGEMLEMARAEAAPAAGVPDGCLVEDAITEALARSSTHTVGRRIETSCPERLSAKINVRALSQVLFTLIENAAKYSPAGSPVRISAAMDGAEIGIRVDDEGPGISPEYREKVFDKFFRVDGVGSSGIGLGLAIARSLITAAGGRIRLDEAPGGGTRVILGLPTADAPEAARSSKYA